MYIVEIVNWTDYENQAYAMKKAYAKAFEFNRKLIDKDDLETTMAAIELAIKAAALEADKSTVQITKNHDDHSLDAEMCIDDNNTPLLAFNYLNTVDVDDVLKSLLKRR